jgi:hypothetical protein
MTDAIPNWRIGPANAMDPARRPAFDVIADALRFYRARWRPILGLSVLVHGTALLLNLPFVASQVEQARAVLVGGLLPTTDQAGAYALGAASGVSAGLWFAASLLLMVALFLLFLTSSAEQSARYVLRLMRQRWQDLAAVSAAVVVGFGTLSSLAAGATWPMSMALVRTPVETARNLQYSFAFLAVYLLIGTAFLYFYLRWAVAPAAVLTEELGIRASLARSSALTHRRRGHVFLVYAAASITIFVVIAIPVITAVGVLFLARSSGLIELAVAAALYGLGVVVAAPISGLVTAVLFCDLRDAGPLSG